MFDLCGDLPDDLNGKYDLIFDGGTLEHLFDVQKAIDNVNKLLKPGGIVIHSVPMSGYINHGFYQFSPTFFFDCYKSNGYDDLKMYIIMQEFDRNWTLLHECCIPYDTISGWEMTLLNDRHCAIWFSATKCKNQKSLRIPIQGFYAVDAEGEMSGRPQVAPNNFPSRSWPRRLVMAIIPKPLKEWMKSNLDRYRQQRAVKCFFDRFERLR